MGFDGIRSARAAVKATVSAGLLLVCFLLLFTGRASAEWTEPFALTETTPFGDSGVKAAVDGEGNATVLLGLADAVAVQRVPAGGEPDPGPLQDVPLTGETSGATLGIGSNAAGRAVAVYGDGAFGNYRPMAVQVEDGEPGEPIDLGGGPDSTVSAPQVAVAPSGDALAVFTYAASDSDPAAAAMVTISADGEVGEITPLAVEGTGSNPQVAVDGDGTFYVTWAESDGSPSTVKAATVSADGEMGPVATAEGENAGSPSIAANPAGDAVVGYAVTGETSSVYIARFDGTGFGPRAALGEGLLGAGAPTVGIDRDGNVAVIWSELVDGISIKYGHMPAGGEFVNDGVISAPGLSFNSKMGVDLDGNAYVVIYTQPVGGEFGAYGRLLSTDGEIGEIQKITAEGEQPTFEQSVAVGQNGGALYTFSYQGEPEGYYASRFSGAVTADPGALDFGAADLGQSVDRTLTLTNSGGSPLAVAGLSLAGDAAADYQVTGDECAGTVVPIEGSCEVSVRFTPSVSGARAASLDIESDAVMGSGSVPLTGSGNASPPPPPPAGQANVKIGKVAPKNVALKRGKSKAVKVTVRNGGDAAATGVKVCLKPNKAAKKKVKVAKCKTLGQIAAGASKTAKIKVTAKKGKKAKGKAKIAVKLSSGNAGSGSSKVTIKVKK